MNGLEITLSKHEYVLEGELSSGAHGACYLVRKNNISYILKDYIHNDDSESSHEAEVYAALHGSGLGSEYFFKAERIKLGNKFYLRSQTYDGETLEAFILNSNNDIPLADKFEILISASKAISKMHEIGYLHLDIKPSNLYISNTKVVKPIDMGSSITANEVKSFEHIMDSVGYMSTNEYASKKVREFNEARADYRNNYAIKKDVHFEYLLSDSEKEYFCKLENSISVQDDIYSLMCCMFYMLTNGMVFKFWVDLDYDKYDDSQQIYSILENNNIPKYIINRLVDFFMDMNQAYADSNASVKYESINDFIKELEILREIMLNQGFHPEVILRNSIKYFEENFSNIEIDPELLTDIEEME